MNTFGKFLFAFFVIFCLFSRGAQSQICDGLESLDELSGKNIGLKNNTLLFTTDELKMDIDGAKNSYGIHDQGVEHICNGLSPVEPKKCQNTFQRGSCFKHCKQKFIEWHKSGHSPADLPKYMRSIGLGGSNGSVPNVKLQPAPRDDWFVSHTSVRYGPWEIGNSTDSIEKQTAQLEPFDIPFFVIPAEFRQTRWDATPGDFGVAVHAQDPGRYVFFIVGDVGGNLDEGSAKLQEALRQEDLKPLMKKNVFGEMVKRYGDLSLNKFSDGSMLDLRIAIFRHTSSFDRKKSGPVVILQDTHDQAQMLTQISNKGEEYLKKFGGAAEVVRCTNGT
jgi:hypothetical protein